MHGGELSTYPPLNTLKHVADDVWVVDGPVIRFGLPRIRFPTRMTVLRLRDGGLFVHSPTPLPPGLKSAIKGLGDPAWIVGPNRIHYWWIPDWHAGFPAAQVYLAPGIKEQAGARIDFDGLTLDRPSGYPWDAEVATLPIAGSYMTEVVFFHHASRTLILADLIENFEPQKLGSAVMRWLTRLGGVQHPDGQTPRDLRLTSLTHRQAVRAAVERMIAWEPERIVLAHGRWYERNGAAELRRAFRWVLA
ncbi:MAG TPA: DUF4336 domain-containing protein [Hyphomicrobiaceae bacterium]|nr:DUF4336 domain-containing protein [Hyphomicrobiaceae bacterium]